MWQKFVARLSGRGRKCPTGTAGAVLLKYGSQTALLFGAFTAATSGLVIFAAIEPVHVSDGAARCTLLRGIGEPLYFGNKTVFTQHGQKVYSMLHASGDVWIYGIDHATGQAYSAKLQTGKNRFFLGDSVFSMQTEAQKSQLEDRIAADGVMRFWKDDGIVAAAGRWLSATKMLWTHTTASKDHVQDSVSIAAEVSTPLVWNMIPWMTKSAFWTATFPVRYFMYGVYPEEHKPAVVEGNPSLVAWRRFLLHKVTEGIALDATEHTVSVTPEEFRVVVNDSTILNATALAVRKHASGANAKANEELTLVLKPDLYVSKRLRDCELLYLRVMWPALALAGAATAKIWYNDILASPHDLFYKALQSRIGGLSFRLGAVTSIRMAIPRACVGFLFVGHYFYEVTRFSDRHAVAFVFGNLAADTAVALLVLLHLRRRAVSTALTVVNNDAGPYVRPFVKKTLPVGSVPIDEMLEADFTSSPSILAREKYDRDVYQQQVWMSSHRREVERQERAALAREEALEQKKKLAAAAAAPKGVAAGGTEDAAPPKLALDSKSDTEVKAKDA